MQEKQIQLLNKAFAETKAMTYLGTYPSNTNESSFLKNLANFTSQIMVHWFAHYRNVPYKDAAKAIGAISFDWPGFTNISRDVPQDVLSFVNLYSPRLFTGILRKFGLGNSQIQCNDLLHRLTYTEIRPLIIALSNKGAILITGPNALRILASDGSNQLNMDEVKKNNDLWIADFSKDRFYKSSELPQEYFNDKFLAQTFTNAPLNPQDKKAMTSTLEEIDHICKILIPSYPFSCAQNIVWCNPNYTYTTPCLKTDTVQTLELFYSAFKRTFTPSVLSNVMLQEIRNSIIEKLRWFLSNVPINEQANHQKANPLVPFTLARLNWNNTKDCVQLLCVCWEICETSKEKDITQKKSASYLMKNIDTMLKLLKEKRINEIPQEHREIVDLVLSNISQQWNNNNNNQNTASTASPTINASEDETSKQTIT